MPGESTWPSGAGEMACRIREHDWAATPLGVIDTWPQALRSTVDMLVANGFPMVALWGPNLIQLYNDGYRALMGIKHPEGLGQPTRECWPEVWHINTPIYDRVQRGETLTFEDSLYPITRSGRLEDAWFTLSYSPLRDDAGAIAGVLVTVTETTQGVKESARRDAAEAALHAREERFRAFVTASADVVYRMSPDWSLMWQLDGAGFLADTAQADEDWRNKYILPDDRERVEAAIRQAIGGKAMFELEHPVIRADGTPGWTSSRAVPILGADGEIVEWLGAAKDVTQRKSVEVALRESEERASFLLHLGDKLRPLADARAIKAAAAALVSEWLDIASAAYAEIEPNGLAAQITDEYNDGRIPSLTTRYVLKDFGSVAAAMQRGETVHFADLDEKGVSPDAQAGFSALNVRAAVAAPLFKDGTLVAYLFVAHPEPRAWSAGDLEIVREAAERTWAAVERARAEAELRESEANYRTLIETMTEGFGICELVRDGAGRVIDWRFLELNPALVQHTGMDPAASVGPLFSELFPGVDRSNWLGVYQTVVDTQTPQSFEDYWPPIDRWLAGEASPAGGERFYIIYRDVTTRKRGEIALRESEERQAFLLKLSDALRPIGDPVEIQGEAARLLGEHLDAGGCNYVEVDAEAGDWVIHRDYRRDGLSSIAGRYRREEWPLFGEDFLRGEPMLIPDIGEYPLIAPEERAVTEALGLGALIIAPITKGGRFLGGMAVTDSKARAWTPDDVALVVEVAERTWAAVERARAKAATREAEALSRIALDSGRMGAWRWDLRTGLICGDPVFLALYGLPPTEDLLSLPMFTERMSPESQAQISAVVAKAIEAGEEFEGDIEIVAGPTAGRWVRWRGRPAVGDTSVLHGVTYDITEQTQADIDLRESERQHAFLLALTDALRPLADARQMVARATQMLGDYMQADRCFVAEMDPDGVNLDVHEEYLRPGASSVIGHHNFDSFGVFVSPVLVRGDILAVEDIATLDLTEAERAHYAAVGIAAYLLVPLVRDGWFAACFAVNHQTPHRWSKADKNIARQVADRTWAAVERARAEAALRDSEERFREFGENSSDALWIVDAETMRLEYLSPAFERIWGESVSAVMEDVGRWAELVHPDDRALAREAMPRLVAGEAFVAEYRIVRPDGEVRWIRDTGFPIKEDGVVKRGGGIAQDVTELRLSQTAVRESEERLRQFGEASQDVLWVRDAGTFQWEYLTPAFETIYGLNRDAALRGDNMANWLELVVPEDRPLAAKSLARVREGEQVTFEYRIRRPSDGQIRWLRNTDFPIRNASGAVQRIGGIGHDITELKRTEEALASAEIRQRALVEGIPQLVWRAIDGGEWTWASPQWAEFTGQAEADSHGWGWLATLHPDDREGAKAAWNAAMDRGALDAEYRIRHADDGSYRWFHTRASPVHDEHGRIVEWLGTSTDIDELRRLQELQKTLLAELQHRVRNVLAVIRSMMRRSSESQESLSEYVQHLEGRLSALARTQVLLTRAADARVDLEDLIRDELLAQAANENNVAISGPDVGLSPKAAEVLSLAIHELMTNAVKYGALARDDATLRIDWRVEERAGVPWLTLLWSELGVAVTATAPRRQGFGTELITRRVPYELKGKGSLQMRPGGIECELEFPLLDRASILQTDAGREPAEEVTV